MAIKMVQDDPNEAHQDYSKKSSASGGGKLSGGLGKIAGTILPFLIKKPKLLIGLVVVGVVLYFLFGKSIGANSDTLSKVSGLFSTGGKFNKEIYEQTEIFEPLADNKKNPLPEKFSLEKYCPTRLDQGKQGSCVAWASAYAARTILEAQKSGKDPNTIRFSPSFMYNQISIDHTSCQGSYIKYAMDNMMNIGAINFKDFKYDENDCTKKPNSSLISQANAFKIKGFQRLTDEKRGKSYEMLAMKQNLANGSPIIIGMMVGGSFMQGMVGKEMWTPTSNDYNQSGFGGHAMCVIGYDDYKEGGAFQIMNSWGKDWGKNGLFWIRYSDFKEFNRESYGLYPMGDASKKNENRFKGNIAFELNDGKKHVRLHQVDENYFETTKPLNKKDKFKIEFTNNIECYVYIFGEEDDKTVDVLFPYTPKHSPFCGITGTRLFPRDYSMQINEKGSLDKFAIVVSKKAIDYDIYCKELNKIKQTESFEVKIRSVFGIDKMITYGDSEQISFDIEAKNSDFISFIIGVGKAPK